MLGYEPHTPISKGIPKFIEWYKMWRSPIQMQLEFEYERKRTQEEEERLEIYPHEPEWT